MATAEMVKQSTRLSNCTDSKCSVCPVNPAEQFYSTESTFSAVQRKWASSIQPEAANKPPLRALPFSASVVSSCTLSTGSKDTLKSEDFDDDLSPADSLHAQPPSDPSSAALLSFVPAPVQRSAQQPRVPPVPPRRSVSLTKKDSREAISFNPNPATGHAAESESRSGTAGLMYNEIYGELAGLQSKNGGSDNEKRKENNKEGRDDADFGGEMAVFDYVRPNSQVQRKVESPATPGAEEGTKDKIKNVRSDENDGVVPATALAKPVFCAYARPPQKRSSISKIVSFWIS